MFDHHDRSRLERMEVAVSLISNRLDRLMSTAQNILDATQNAVSAIQTVPAAVAALIQRLPVPTDPTAVVLSAADAQTVTDGLNSIASTTQQFIDQLNTILPVA